MTVLILKVMIIMIMLTRINNDDGNMKSVAMVMALIKIMIQATVKIVNDNIFLVIKITAMVMMVIVIMKMIMMKMIMIKLIMMKLMMMKMIMMIK